MCRLNERLLLPRNLHKFAGFLLLLFGELFERMPALDVTARYFLNML